MAIINSLALGKARKSAGALTFSTIKGRTIAREKPAHVRNPQTNDQMAQRGKLSNLVASWRTHGVLLKKLFTVVDGYGSGYNQFVKMNMGKANLINPTSDGYGKLVDEMFLGNGKYNQATLSYNMDEVGSNQEINFNNAAMIQEVKEGDEVGIILYSAGQNKLEIIKKTLTASDVSTIVSTQKLVISQSLPFTPDSYCPYWYSATRNFSTTAQLIGY